MIPVRHERRALARDTGKAMITAALIAVAIQPGGFTWAGASLLTVAGLGLWYTGADKSTTGD